MSLTQAQRHEILKEMNDAGSARNRARLILSSGIVEIGQLFSQTPDIFEITKLEFDLVDRIVVALTSDTRSAAFIAQAVRAAGGDSAHDPRDSLAGSPSGPSRGER